MDLSNLEQELDAMKPPARDVKSVRVQIDDVNKLINKVRCFSCVFGLIYLFYLNHVFMHIIMYVLPFFALKLGCLLLYCKTPFFQ